MENKQNKTQASHKPHVSVFTRFSAWLFSLLRCGMFGKFFTSYDEGNKDYRNAIKKREVTGQNVHSVRRRVAKTFEKSIFARTLPKIAGFLLRLSVRDYSLMLVSMGIISALLYPLRDIVIITAFKVSLESFIMGLILVILALPTLFSSKSFAEALLTGRITQKIFFDFLGFKEATYREASEKSRFSNPSVSALIGVALGFVSYLSNPFAVFGIIILIFFAFEVISTPEVGIVFVILALPFANEYTMAGVSLFVLFAYVLKCIIVKRTFKFELMDIAVLLLLCACIYGGLVSLNIGSSIKIALINISLISVFFLISNLVRSKEWYGRILYAMLTISAIVAVSAIVEYALGSVQPDLGFFSNYIIIKDSVTLGFISADALAIYLSASIPFVIGYIASAKKARAKFGGFILYLIEASAIVITFSRIGYVAGIIASLLTLLIYNKNAIYLIFAILGVMPILNYTLPIEIKSEIASIGTSYANSHAYQMNALFESIDILKAHPFGIGFGKESFSQAMAEIGGTSSGYMENLFLFFFVLRVFLLQMLLLYLLIHS